MKELNTKNELDYTPVLSKTIDEMESVCKARFNRTFYIKNHSYIDYKTLTSLRKLIKETSQQIVMEYIETAKPGEHPISYSFLVEDLCSYCNTLGTEKIGKTKLLDYISNHSDFKCECCKQKQNQIIKEKFDKILQEQEQQKKENTIRFINSYCNPTSSWKPEVNPKSYFGIVQNWLFKINKEVAIDNLKSLSYKEFLKTPYWIAVSTKKKYQANFMCELCGSRGPLNVHHKTYIHHGDEINNLKDLIVLCSECHGKFHDIVD